MAKIIINEEITDVSCLTNLLEIITKQINEGFTSGYYPTWKLELNEEETILVKESVEENWEV